MDSFHSQLQTLGLAIDQLGADLQHVRAALDRMRSGASAPGFTFIDLFCGVGGFHQALRSLGGTCVLACDIDPHCRTVYEDNYGIRPHDDVTTLDPVSMPDFDVLCGGFPCFVAGTRVLTDSGYKPIETVGLRDRLYTHTGACKPIVNLQRKAYTGRPLYTIHVATRSRPLICTPEHPFYVRDLSQPEAPPCWIAAQDLDPARHCVGMVLDLSSPVRGAGYSDAYDAVLLLQHEFLRARQPASICDDDSLCDKDNGDIWFDDAYAWFRIQTIVCAPPRADGSAGSTLVYNFEVADDNSYIVENTVVHNCQAFSHAGKQGGFADTRGTLFHDIVRILRAKQPAAFVLENVKNLLGHAGGATWATIHAALTSAGYAVPATPAVLSPHTLGVPQHRERVLILGVRQDRVTAAALPPLPAPPLPAPATCIYDILLDDAAVADEPGLALGAADCAVVDLWDELVQHFVRTGVKLPGFPLWSDVWDTAAMESGVPAWKARFLEQNRAFYAAHRAFLEPWLARARATAGFAGAKRKFEWQCGAMQTGDSLWELLFQFRPSGIRVKRPTYSPALVAMAQIVYIGKKRRRLCAREVARLQSFPDTFRLPASTQMAYRQFGNSVNVRVIQYAAKHVLKCAGFSV